jgi:uncharacterized protein (DUF1330 family)
MTIHDPARFKDYTALSAPAVHAAGGKYVVAGVRPEVLEGDFSAHRIVVVEFETAARARAFYHSAAIGRRGRSAKALPTSRCCCWRAQAPVEL